MIRFRAMRNSQRAFALPRPVPFSTANDAEEDVLCEVVGQIGAAGRETQIAPERLLVLFKERSREIVGRRAGHTMYKRTRTRKVSTAKTEIDEIGPNRA